jgi:hypothetical protein
VVEPRILKGKESEGLSMHFAKKSITIDSENDTPVLEITNEYGDSVGYEIRDGYRLNELWSDPWQFVNDSQQ